MEDFDSKKKNEHVKVKHKIGCIIDVYIFIFLNTRFGSKSLKVVFLTEPCHSF
jgi:hypothetical protein